MKHDQVSERGVTAAQRAVEEEDEREKEKEPGKGGGGGEDEREFLSLFLRVADLRTGDTASRRAKEDSRH